jgi:predicted alpha/beta superfamily hydrolase
MTKNKLILLLALCIFEGRLLAQQIPGSRDSLTSTVLKEKRYLQVVLPPNYNDEPKGKFDVIYVLDGDWNTKLMSDVEEVLGRDGRIPRNIIVGILNTDRDRDFLPTHNGGNPTSGGAEQFLGFLKNELIPYINKTYRSNGENTLFGHSFGGVFVTYALLTEPQLFDSYIAGDPSFWWDNAEMLKWVPSKLPGLTILGKTLYITGREGPDFKTMCVFQMDTILKNHAPATLSYKVTAYSDETHGTVRLKSAFDGLKFSYPDFSDRIPGGINFHPMNGILLKNKPITLWYFRDTTEVRYTTDGSMPGKGSPLMQKNTLLTRPSTVTIRRMKMRSADDETFSGTFTAGDYFPPGKLDTNLKPGGFNYAYYEGEWTKLPDFKTLTPLKAGRADASFSIYKMPRQDNFAIVVSGQLEIKETGYYMFQLNSDDGSKLYLGDRLLIDFDGLHGDQGDGKSFIIPLKKGFYALREEYFQKDDGRSLRLGYVTPGTMTSRRAEPIPLALQYGRSD